MKYLAFDIEAANGYKLYSICSIGIVVADENFNVEWRKNVWINPKSTYNLNGTRKNVGIDLHLDKKLLDSSPDFSQVYDEIKALLTDEDCLVVGHAVDSDVRMLNAACQRYHLPSINFSFMCSQLLYRLYRGEKDVKALSKIAADLGITYNEHNSEDDAWMSLKTLEFLTKDSGLSVMQLAEKYHVRLGNNNNFELTRPVSLDGQVSKKGQTLIAVNKIKDYAKGIKKTSSQWKNNVFCLARSLELAQDEKLLSVVKTIAQRGGRYASKLVKCNVYVKNDLSLEQDEMRERRVAELAEQNLLKVVTVQQILDGNLQVEVSCMKQKVEEFLCKHGESGSQVDAAAQISRFQQTISQGLRAHGGIIPMIPTYLCNVDRSKISQGKRILIDAGGTNFRSAVGYFQDGKVKIEKLQKTTMPASKGEVLSKQQFYNKIASNVAYLAEDGGDVGFCFSYPVDMSADMDGIVTTFSKEVKAPEVIGTRVGAETLSALGKFSSKQRKIVILNDTVATLLGGMATSDKTYSTYLGYIYGTGTNVCCIVDTAQITKESNLPQGKMLVNMECGGYDGFVLGDFDKIAINLTDAPGKQLFEKMTSGKYLSEIIYQTLCGAQKEDLLSVNANVSHFELKDVSEFLSDSGEMMEFFHCDQDVAAAKEICRQLIDRAAKLGAIANAATAIFTCGDKSLPVAIVAEGTTFNKLVGYRSAFEGYLHEFLAPRGISFEIVQGEELNLVGTLMATMAL